MPYLTKVLVKRFGLPIMCLVFVSFVYLRHKNHDRDLVRVLLGLQKAQRSQILLIQRDNSNFEEKCQNDNKQESVNIELRNVTRKWFDSRQPLITSKLAASGHPLFPGYVIENPDLCKAEVVDMLIYLHSAVDHRESRRKIRENWANHRTFVNINVKLVFILGKPNSSIMQHHIESEFSTYGDIVQGNFADTFKNLTYKAITMLVWVNSHCSGVRYIVKVDDDMFVDIYKVVSDIVPPLVPKKLAIACDVKNNMSISRDDPRTKWYVNTTLLPGRTTWPRFCSGYFAVFTGDCVPALYEASFDIKQLIPIDDAYLFGLLVEKNVSVEFINIHDQISVNSRPDADKEIIINGAFQFISFRVNSPDDHMKLWTLRTAKLSLWEQAHSNYFDTFRDSKHNSVSILKRL